MGVQISLEANQRSLTVTAHGQVEGWRGGGGWVEGGWVEEWRGLGGGGDGGATVRANYDPRILPRARLSSAVATTF